MHSPFEPPVNPPPTQFSKTYFPIKESLLIWQLLLVLKNSRRRKIEVRSIGFQVIFLGDVGLLAVVVHGPTQSPGYIIFYLQTDRAHDSQFILD